MTLLSKARTISVSMFLFALSGTGNAAIWNISSVEMGTDGGFGFSGFHYSGNAGSGANHDNNAMTGSTISDSDIDSFTTGGTYNDSTGAFNISLILDNGNNVVDFTGNLNLNPGAYSFLNASFQSALSLPTNETLGNNVQIGYIGGPVCCNGQYKPNGFEILGNTAIMSLWGASWDYGNNQSFNGSYEGSLLGMDLRLKFNKSPNNNSVPEPSTWLLITLAIGGMGFSRLKKKV